MTQEDLKMFEIFFNEIRREEREILSKKQYQINIKESILHIVEVIENQAEQEQLNQYNNIKVRVEDTVNKIDETIHEIVCLEEILSNIELNLEKILKEEKEAFDEQVIFVKNEIEEYSQKKKYIESIINENKIGFILKELNYIAECINSAKGKRVFESCEIEINLKPTLKETPKQTEVQEKVETTNECQMHNESTNILIISERDNKVYLPYTRADIDYYLNTNKYSSEEQIIQKVFTIPLSNYSNYALSRITEGFKLMREREKASFGESLKYAFNLFFERNLHPAIITACKTQDDLDIYLACLQDNMLELFDSFEIRFDYAPIKVKRNEKLEYFEGV